MKAQQSPNHKHSRQDMLYFKMDEVRSDFPMSLGKIIISIACSENQYVGQLLSFGLMLISPFTRLCDEHDSWMQEWFEWNLLWKSFSQNSFILWETLYSFIIMSVDDIHNRHTISCPHWQTMGCLLWIKNCYCALCHIMLCWNVLQGEPTTTTNFWGNCLYVQLINVFQLTTAADCRYQNCGPASLRAR